MKRAGDERAVARLPLLHTRTCTHQILGIGGYGLPTYFAHFPDPATAKLLDAMLREHALCRRGGAWWSWLAGLAAGLLQGAVRVLSAVAGSSSSSGNAPPDSVGGGSGGGGSGGGLGDVDSRGGGGGSGAERGASDFLLCFDTKSLQHAVVVLAISLVLFCAFHTALLVSGWTTRELLRGDAQLGLRALRALGLGEKQPRRNRFDRGARANCFEVFPFQSAGGFVRAWLVPI